MSDVERIKEELADLKPQLERFHVKDIRLFGSIVRGDETGDSDIDLLVAFTDDADLYDVAELTSFLEDRLGREVDVVSENALRPEFRESVMREAVAV